MNPSSAIDVTSSAVGIAFSALGGAPDGFEHPARMDIKIAPRERLGDSRFRRSSIVPPGSDVGRAAGRLLPLSRRGGGAFPQSSPTAPATPLQIGAHAPKHQEPLRPGLVLGAGGGEWSSHSFTID